MDYRDRSKQRFEEEAKKLIKDLFVSALDRAEKILRPNKRGPQWEQFRFEILNLGNAALRDFSGKLDDYKIEFRPQIVFGVKYIGDNTRKDVAEQVTRFAFSFVDGQPNIKIALTDNDENNKLLNEIWKSVRCGVVFSRTGFVNWEANGLAEIFTFVIPFFDENRCFKGKALEDYTNWKEKVYRLEAQGVGNAKKDS